MNQTTHPGDLWSGLALCALGFHVMSQAWQWDYSGADGPGPGFFPFWYGLAMSVVSLWVVIQASLRRPISSAPIDWRGAGRPLAAWLAFALAVAAMPLAGFFMSFALLSLFVIAVMYRQPLARAVLVSSALAAGFHAVFVLALDVPLPAGMFGF